MPTITNPQIDVANVASKMPSSLQYPTGLALALLQRAGGGNDPASVLTTVGPNAIPLDNEEEYLRKVLGSTLGDAGEVLKNARTGVRPMITQSTRRIMDEMQTQPDLVHKVEWAAEAGPKEAQRVMNNWAPGNTDALDRLIQTMSDAYHKGFR